MSESAKQIRRRRDARAQLARLIDNSENVVVIHYSCESLYDRPNGASPRITSIAVRNLGTGQATSFSIHQMAERDKKLNPPDIEANYDDLEKKMLKEFYEYVETHQGHVLAHRELEFLPLGISELRKASCQEGRGIVPRRFIAFVPIPERVKGEQGQGVPGPGSGLGPWGGARVAPLRCPILRPGHFSL